MMNILRMGSSFKKVFIGSALVGSYLIAQKASEISQMNKYLEEARHISKSLRYPRQKTFIITDTKDKNFKAFRQYAEPMFLKSGVDYTILCSRSLNYKAIHDVISSERFSRIVLMGDDRYVSQTLNNFYHIDSRYTESTTFGIIPLSSHSSISTKLGYPKKYTSRVCKAALTCIEGRPTEVYPFLISSGGNECISFSSVKTGYFALFEDKLANDKLKYMFNFKYPIYFMSALQSPIVKHTLKYNFMDKIPGSIDSGGFCVSTDVFCYSPLKLRYIKNDIPFIDTLKGILSDNPFSYIVIEDENSYHQGITYFVGGNPLIFGNDGILHTTDTSISIAQSQIPLFKVFTMYEMQKIPQVEKAKMFATKRLNRL